MSVMRPARALRWLIIILPKCTSQRAQAATAAVQDGTARTMQMLSLVPGSRLGHGPTSARGAACASVEDTSAATAPSAAAATLTA